MAQTTSDNFQLNAAKALDNRTGVLQSGVWRPFNDIAEYNSLRPAPGRYENELFWVRSTADSNKSDLYSLRKDKTPYKVLGDVDFSNYYTKGQIDTIVDEVEQLIASEASARQAADEVLSDDIHQVQGNLTAEVSRAIAIENQLQKSIESILPGALEGQVLRSLRDNDNKYKGSNLINYGRFVTTEEELQAAENVYLTPLQIFQTFSRGSYGDNGATSSVIPRNPSDTQTWEFDAVNNLFQSTNNIPSYSVLISPNTVEDYEQTVELKSTNAEDNDVLSVVVAYVEAQPEFDGDVSYLVDNNAYRLPQEDYPRLNVTYEKIPKQFTLSAIRCRTNQAQFLVNGTPIRWAIVYNFRQPDQFIVASGNNQVPQITSNWNGASVKIRTVKSENKFKIATTIFSDQSGDYNTFYPDIEIDLDANPTLYKFRGATKYGFGAESQANSTFKILSSSILQEANTIYDTRDGSVLTADALGNYSVDASLSIYKVFGIRIFIRNLETGLLGYIREDKSVDVIASTNTGIAKTQLSTDGTPLVISWQTDVDPDGDGVQTYADRHGNKIPTVTGEYINSELARHVNYIPSLSFTYSLSDPEKIEDVYIDDLQEGKIVIF